MILFYICFLVDTLSLHAMEFRILIQGNISPSGLIRVVLVALVP